MRPPPVNVCQADRLECPSPVCRKRIGAHKMLAGWIADECPHCGVNYFAWGNFGVAQIIGLTPEQAASLDVHERRLTTILRGLGRIAA